MGKILLIMSSFLLIACNQNQGKKTAQKDYEHISTATGEWQLVWDEEFDYWLARLRKMELRHRRKQWGWGNNEAQHYTANDSGNGS